MKSNKKVDIDVVKQFFILHCEKFVLAVLVLVACYIAYQGLSYKPLEWKPNELAQTASSAKKTIETSQQSAADEGVAIFSYDTLASQIKVKVQSSPYQTKITWMPSLIPSPEKRQQVQFLPADEIKAETDRGVQRGQSYDTIWVDITAPIPEAEQTKRYTDAYTKAVKVEPATRNIPKYYACDFERAEVMPGKPLQWKPLSDYLIPLEGNTRGGSSRNSDRFGAEAPPPVKIIQDHGKGIRSVQYTDYDVKPGTTYVYRMKYFLENPNYQLPAEYVEDGVSTTAEYLESEWSDVSSPVFVPGLTRIRVMAVTPPDRGAWTQLRTPWNAPSGKVELVRFDIDTGLEESMEMTNVITRGSVCNIKQQDDSYLSDACVLDMYGGRTITKGRSKLASSTPDLQVPAKMLVLHPNGNLTVESYEDPALAKNKNKPGPGSRGPRGSERRYESERRYDSDDYEK